MSYQAMKRHRRGLNIYLYKEISQSERLQTVRFQPSDILERENYSNGKKNNACQRFRRGRKKGKSEYMKHR